MNRTDRLYALVEELRATAPRARSAFRLAERFEVSVRTIERDILALQETSVPIWATSGRNKNYTIDPTHTLPPLNFTTSEATSIALTLARSGPMPFDNAARTALHKVITTMPATGRTNTADLLARIHLMHTKRKLSDPPVLRTIEQTLLERRLLCLDYCDKQGHRTEARLVEPLGFIGSERDWYLVGGWRLRGGARVFRLDRIGTIEMTAERSPAREPPALEEGCLPQQAWHPAIVG